MIRRFLDLALAAFTAWAATALLATALAFVLNHLGGGRTGSWETALGAARMVFFLALLLASPLTFLMFPLLALAGRVSTIPLAGAIGGLLVFSLPIGGYQMAIPANWSAASLILVVGPLIGWLGGHIFAMILSIRRLEGEL